MWSLQVCRKFKIMLKGLANPVDSFSFFFMFVYFHNIAAQNRYFDFNSH